MALQVRKFDAVIVGAGGAGLRAAYELSKAGLKVAALSKVFPTRSHTVAAQGGVGAALGNMGEDHWHWHMYDTVKGSDWLGDQDAIEFMCRMAPEVVIELEHFGMPFDRNDNGTIYQRPFGGHSANFGEKPVQRSSCAADRTGHAMLHALYQRNVHARTQFFVEWMALDIIRDTEGRVLGVTALEMETGDIVIFQGKATLFATGGGGRIYASSTNAFINMGDGVGMAARAGIPLEDMEFWQFHPTGVAGAGVLITEGVRGEGGILLNKSGERFMERYAPTMKDLASRDVVSRAMATEIKEGRGAGPHGDYILLKLDHLGPDVINKRLPGIREIALKFANIDPVKEPIPVVPTCHYQMGGIPTNYHGEVVVPMNGNMASVVPGFYAAGECGCASIHGANRLGTNSLTDLLVMGKSSALSMLEFIRSEGTHYRDLPKGAGDESLARVAALDAKTGGANVDKTRGEIQRTMQAHCGVFRFPDLLVEGVSKIKGLADAVANLQIGDKSKVFNTARIEALELQNLYETARATMISAEARKETRGAHDRADFHNRDDQNWLKHTLWYREGDRLEYKPVNLKPLTVETIPPKARVYYMKFRIERFNPEKDAKPYFQDYDVELKPADRMLLDALVRIKMADDTLSLRRSCREGICGSDAMNINGKNGLACITKIVDLKEPVVLRALPGMPIIRDLIVDMTHFFAQYHSVKPYLINDDPPPEKERLQSPTERAELDGLYECILCACCSTSCPSFWWNPDKFVGPAGLLNAYRFIADSRDQAVNARLDDLKDPYRLFRCHTIMNCVDVCPKSLNPTAAIGKIKDMMIRRAV